MRKGNKAIPKVLGLVLSSHLNQLLQVTVCQLSCIDHSSPSLLVCLREIVLANHAELFVKFLNLLVQYALLLSGHALLKLWLLFIKQVLDLCSLLRSEQFFI
jgi:hypothetical protein